MILAPLLHALDVERTMEVMPVFLLPEPLLLACSLAGLSAFGLLAVLMVPGVAGIWREEVVTVLALALSDPFCH
jgi:hypothetical protein